MVKIKCYDLGNEDDDDCGSDIWADALAPSSDADVPAICDADGGAADGGADPESLVPYQNPKAALVGQELPCVTCKYK